MASIALTAPESFGFAKGATLYGCVINGFNSGAHPAALPTGAQQTSFYVGATVPTPLTGLKLGASYDYASQSSVVDSTATAFPAAHQEAVAGYLSFQATEKLSLHARGEYFWQSTSLANELAGSASGPIFASLPSKVMALTGTIQYDL